MKANALANITSRYTGLRVFSDEHQTRISFPIASDQIIYRHSSEPLIRPSGELLEVVEKTLGGKFQLPVELSAEKALEPASGRSLDTHRPRPLATLEIWSLEPGTYDLVLNLPGDLANNEALATHLVSKFVDQAREVGRVIDNTDLLRFQSGPSLSVTEAQNRLSQLEAKTGTRLDTESLLTIMGNGNPRLLN